MKCQECGRSEWWFYNQDETMKCSHCGNQITYREYSGLLEAQNAELLAVLEEIELLSRHANIRNIAANDMGAIARKAIKKARDGN